MRELDKLAAGSCSDTPKAFPGSVRRASGLRAILGGGCTVSHICPILAGSEPRKKKKNVGGPRIAGKGGNGCQ